MPRSAPGRPAAGAQAAIFASILTIASIAPSLATTARMGRVGAYAEEGQLAPGPRSSFDLLGSDVGNGEAVTPVAEDGALDMDDMEGDYTILTTHICNGVAGLCDLPLEWVSFAGAHASASYGATFGCNKRVTSYLCPLLSKMSSCFLEAQTMDVHELLGTGARYLHTDVCIDDGGFVYACYGLDNNHMGLGPPLSSFLTAVKSFLDGNPRDVVLLHVDEVYGPPDSVGKLKNILVEEVAVTFGLRPGSLLFRKRNVMSGGATIPVAMMSDDGARSRSVHQHWPTLGAMVHSNQRLVFMVSPGVYQTVAGRKGDFILNVDDYFASTKVIEHNVLQMTAARMAMESGCHSITSSGRLGLLNAHIKFDFRKVISSAVGSVVESKSTPSMCLKDFSKEVSHSTLPHVYNYCYERLPGTLVTSVDLYGASFAQHYTTKRNEQAVNEWMDEVRFQGLADRLPWAPVRVAAGEDTLLDPRTAHGGPESFTLADKQNCMGCLYILDTVVKAAKDSKDKTTDTLGMILEDACTNLAAQMFSSTCDELYSEEMVVIKLLQLDLSSDEICRQRGLCEDSHFKDGFAPQDRALRGILGGPMPVLGAERVDSRAQLQALDQGDMSAMGGSR